MIRDVFITEANCITPLGFSLETNIQNIENGVSGIRLHENPKLMNKAFYASIIDDEILN